MPADTQQCNNGYCVSDQQAHEAMAKHPELAERYVNESPHIRDAIKTLLHADGGLTRLHWLELHSLMRKLGNDIALMHHANFRNLAAPNKDLAHCLRMFYQAIWCLQEIMWAPDAPSVSEYRPWMLHTPPQLARFTASQQYTRRHPMRSQNVRPLLPASRMPEQTQRTGITASQWKLPPRRIQRSSSEAQALDSSLPSKSPSMAGAGTSVGGQLALGMMASSNQSPTIPTDTAATMTADPSTSGSKGILSPKRRHEPDACSQCKLKKTGCGGRYKHCLKKSANIGSPTAASIKKARPHARLNRRAASFPINMMTGPAFDREFSQQVPRSDPSIPAAEDPHMTGFKGNAPLDGSATPASEAAFGLQYAHPFPFNVPSSAQNSSGRQVLPGNSAQSSESTIFGEPTGGLDRPFVFDEYHFENWNSMLEQCY